VADMCTLGKGLEGMDDGGVSASLLREEQLWGECCTIVANVVLQVDTSDE
jgi:hypothetical protein